MPRSIRLYALYTDEDVGKIRAKISKYRPQSPIVEVNGKKYLPEILVRGERGSDHLYGTVRIPTETAADDGPVLGHSVYAFYLGKIPQTAVIQSSQKAPYDVLRTALGDATAIQPHVYDKRIMVKISDAIRASGNAIIHDPRFEFEGSNGYHGLSRSGFTVTRTRCATTRLDYGEMLKRSSIFEPVLRVFQADGICDEKNETGRLLKINRHFGFSMYVDVSLDLWVQFVKKYVLPALKRGI